MIIPVKCFTCGKVIADKYRYFLQRTQQIKIERGMNPNEPVYIDNISPDDITKAPEGLVLDELGLDKQCCRRHMITHVDLK